MINEFVILLYVNNFFVLTCFFRPVVFIYIYIYLQVFEDTGIARMVGDLQVKCTNNEQGCGWIGDLRDVQVLLLLLLLLLLLILDGRNFNVSYLYPCKYLW